MLVDCLSTGLPGGFFLALVKINLSNFIYTIAASTPCYFHETGDNFGIHLWKLIKDITAEEMIPVKLTSEKTSILGENQALANKASFFESMYSISFPKNKSYG